MWKFLSVRRGDHFHPAVPPDDPYHGEPHVDDVDGVAGPGDGEAGHAVVAVAQDLDPQALPLLGIDLRILDQHNTLVSTTSRPAPGPSGQRCRTAG